MLWNTVDGDDMIAQCLITAFCSSSRICVLEILAELGKLELWPGMVGFA